MRFALLALAWMFGVSQCGTVRAEDLRLSILPNDDDSGVTLRGPESRSQLVVCLSRGGRQEDVTRSVRYSVEPAGIVRVDAVGRVTPVADGDVRVTVAIEGVTAAVTVRVDGMASQTDVSFRNQIVPIFTRLGCNGGGCHGKSGGQNGFALSLLGFYPNEDYEFLVKEGRGRRVFPAAPEESLLLTKPVGVLPHGGGKRMNKDSPEFRLIARWIEQGMPYGSDKEPSVVSIRCVPDARVMRPETKQQIAVLATYSDGSTEDVTLKSLFEPNDTEMAEVSEGGLVSTQKVAGGVAIMARYQGQVATFRSTIPLGAEVAALPTPANLIDEAVFARLKMLGIPPSEVCNDATFLRRVSVDIGGTLPTEAEVKAFLVDESPDKRAKLVDRLLESENYADYFANKWNMVLRNKKQRNEDVPALYGFHQWIRDSIYDNKPYDQFVGEILTATGDASFNPPVAWYREVDQREEQVEDTAQLFLGMRVQCAKCHHHPYEKWSQDDYYGLSAFFSRIGKKRIPGASNQVRDRRLFHNEGTASARNPRSGRNLRPTGLGEAKHFEVPANRDPRRDLATWLSKPNNPFFAKALVNRYWKHFFSRGIVEPEDDMRATNPPTNPELLENLSRHFVESKFDLKNLIRTICKSKTYQLSAAPNAYNGIDKQNYSRFYPRRLTAEVLYDAFHQVSGVAENLTGVAVNGRALQLADGSNAPYFLKVFGQPEAETACECERSPDANLAQCLHLLNSKEIQKKLAENTGRANKLASDKSRTDEQKVRELYIAAMSREPDAAELKVALDHIKSQGEDKKSAYEDLVLVLVNTKEFLFNH